MQPGQYVDAGWSIERRHAGLMVRGGADELLLIDEVPDAVAVEILAVAEGNRQDVTLSPGARQVVDELERIGVVVDTRTSKEPLRVCVRVLDPIEGLLERVEAALRLQGAVPIGHEENAELIVYLRTTATLAAVAGVASEHPSVPHLLIDAAYHHTVSLGPLVVHGETACLRCLADRVASRWGDDPPPVRPAAVRHADFLAGVVAVEVAKLTKGDRSLVNRTVALDLRRWRCTEGTVLKLPGCQACTPVPCSRGRLDLPWKH